MNFGLYLLKNNKIDEKTLLDSLETQYKSLPDIISILRKNLGISDATLVNIIQKQDSKGLSIIEAIKASEEISQQQLIDALQIQNKEVVTIAEILVNNNVINETEIQTLVDDYLLQDQPINKAKATASSAPDSDEPPVNQAAIDSMKEIFGEDSPEVKEMEAQLAAFESGQATSIEKKASDISQIDESFYSCLHQVDKDFISELILKFNAKEIVELSKSLKSLKENPEIMEEVLQKLHIIQGASKLAGTKVLSTSLSVLENFIQKLDPHNISEEQAEKVYQFFSIIVKLRNHIEQEQTEADFFSEANRKVIYSDIHQYLTA